MGTYISVYISKSVRASEWNEVYEETLELVKAFPFAEIRKVRCLGIRTTCLVKTEEHDHIFSSFNSNEIIQGWRVDGDYETMRRAETFYLSNDIFDEHDQQKYEDVDALWGLIPYHLDEFYNDSREKSVKTLWNNKTQGEPYHIYLLSVACLIADRLKEKVFVSGDITIEQCSQAVELANKYLNKPIKLPDQCDKERFFHRVSKLPLSEENQYIVFDEFYLGQTNSTYGEFIRSHYSNTILDKMWVNKFKRSYIDSFHFKELIINYLLWGFDFTRLCQILNEIDLKKPVKAIKYILDTNIYLEEKNYKNNQEIDVNEITQYNIYELLFNRFGYFDRINSTVNRYIPMDEIKHTLKMTFGDKCNIDEIVDNYLKEKDNENLKPKMQKEHRKKEKYDINTCEELIWYEDGDSIAPKLVEEMKKHFEFYEHVLTEKSYKKLMRLSPIDRCDWLVDANDYFLIKKEDWEKIFFDIQNNELSFARYYPMTRVQIKTVNSINITLAFVLNDALYHRLKNFDLPKQ